MPFKTLCRKGARQILSYLGRVGEAGYYELYKQGYVVSRQTFASLIKDLEREGLIRRRLIEARPPRVRYSLTEKGGRVVEILKSLEEVEKK